MGTISELDVDDKTITTTVEELARLNKVAYFIDEIIKSIDAELTPKSVLDNCHSQSQACLNQVTAYTASRAASHLVQANEHADNLLTYIRPYMVLPREVLPAYSAATEAYSDTLKQHAENYNRHIANITTELNATIEKSRQQQSYLNDIESKVKELEKYLYEGDADFAPAEEFTRSAVKEITEHHKAISELKQSLLDGPESTFADIKTNQQQIIKISSELSELLDSSTQQTNDLTKFHNKIFGIKKGDDDEIAEGGLKQELEERLRQLNSFEAEQKNRHKTLYTSIEALLPGATSAGLASAYKTLKDYFSTPIQRYTVAFYSSMAALLIGGLFLVTDSLSLWPPSITFIKATDWQEIIRNLLMRSPIVLPVIWLAIFSATRRSQYERLQQEYAHKEAFAASYESYKKQLSDLQVTGDELQKELIAKAIDAIAFNASSTLDGKHTEKPPILQALEKLNIDEVKKLIDLVKKKD
ncbi:hypothetical protein AB1288_01175 [Pseudomonas putida]|uniref:hypothetical protein n=1 Tax=Pseudomonas putida group TaxID=136845 RepID=UPI00118152B8|nr:hypothetical protein [Pseudomonas alloputida]